jgi:apolipoprotein N-acyltransferase
METQPIAYPPSRRLAAALLVLVSRGSPLALAALVAFGDAWLGTAFRLDNPLRLLRAFAAFCLAPGIAAWLLERAAAVEVAVDRGALVLEDRAQRVEVPCDAIDGVVPWAIPLPSAGVWLRLASGRRFPYALQVADPIAFADALADAGAPDRVRAVSRQPAAIYARSRRISSRRWYHPALKFVVFALVPALPLFRLHQWIAYGGTFGEYYTYGLQPYLLGLAIYWSTAAVVLVLWAAVLRAVAEPVVLAIAHFVPAQTPRTRRIVETVIRILYFGGALLFLLRVFFGS